MYGFKVRRGLSVVVDDGTSSEGCGFEVRRVGRPINAAAMFRYGGREGEREGLGKFRWPILEVRLRGLNFFQRISGAIYVVKGKMTRRTPMHRLTEGPTRVEGEFGTVLNICIW